ncbi:hypothetical protein COSO111634_08255 [Corallococcus soli]
MGERVASVQLTSRGSPQWLYVALWRAPSGSFHSMGCPKESYVQVDCTGLPGATGSRNRVMLVR